MSETVDTQIFDAPEPPSFQLAACAVMCLFHLFLTGSAFLEASWDRDGCNIFTFTERRPNSVSRGVLVPLRKKASTVIVHQVRVYMFEHVMNMVVCTSYIIYIQFIK